MASSAKPKLVLPHPTAEPPYFLSPLTRDRQVPAWLMSLVLHTVLFTLLLLVLKVTPKGAAEIEHREGGIVLADTSAEVTEYLSEGDFLESGAAASNVAAQQSSPPSTSVDDLPPDLPGMDSSPMALSGVGDALVDSLPGADQLLKGDGPGQGGSGGGKVTTQVFGVKGTGTKFVYVFDRSKSMEGYDARPLLAARQELIRSLRSLGDKHQFQILFYNEDVTMFKPGQQGLLHFATDEIKDQAYQFVNRVRGDGGTDHLNALQRALALKPDVIFFLTDAEGGFTPVELNQIGRWNRAATVINAIEFGEQQGRDRSLERLTRENGGQYIFKDIRTLKLE